MTTQRIPTLLPLLLLLAGAAACDRSGGDVDADAESVVADAGVAVEPEELGRLGGRIHAEPERTADILAEAGLDWPTFEEAVRDVSTDVDAAREYRDGFESIADGDAADAELDPAETAPMTTGAGA